VTRRRTSIAILLVSLFVWISTVLWLPPISTYLQKNIAECKADAASETCARALAKIGATGDLFGAVNSLFSGLALFAVAWTLWIDSRSRQESQKPLLVFELDDDGTILNEASFADPRSVRLELDGSIHNMGSAAINAKIDVSLVMDGRIAKLETFSHLMPLAMSAKQAVSFKARLGRADIETIVACCHARRPTLLEVSVTCTSLESVCWRTGVRYQLDFDPVPRLEALLGRDQAEFDRAWGGGAAVGARVRVEAGSWSHTRIG
jgi:hypothetical protein